eukprot:scaffold116949_cov32-Tisochrysis_lutea.AAC.3
MRRRVLTAALHAAPGARRALSTGAAASTSAEQAADSLASLLKTHHITPSAPLDPPSLARRLKFLEALGVKDLAKAARARPELLHTEPEALASRLNYLLGLGVTNLRAAVRHAPALLTSNLTHDLHLKVLILGSLGVTDIAKFIERYPRIVNLDLETQMRPATELLRCAACSSPRWPIQKPFCLGFRQRFATMHPSLAGETIFCPPRLNIIRLLSQIH